MHSRVAKSTALIRLQFILILIYLKVWSYIFSTCPRKVLNNNFLQVLKTTHADFQHRKKTVNLNKNYHIGWKDFVLAIRQIHDNQLLVMDWADIYLSKQNQNAQFYNGFRIIYTDQVITIHYWIMRLKIYLEQYRNHS